MRQKKMSTSNYLMGVVKMDIIKNDVELLLRHGIKQDER